MAGYGLVVLADATTGKELAILKGRELWNVNSVAFSPDGEELAAGGTGSVKIWDVGDVLSEAGPE